MVRFPDRLHEYRGCNRDAVLDGKLTRTKKKEKKSGSQAKEKMGKSLDEEFPSVAPKK